MLPRPPVHYLADGARPHATYLCYLPLLVLARRVCGANPADALIGQFVEVLLLATRQTFWVPMRTVLLATRQTLWVRMRSIPLTMCEAL